MIHKYALKIAGDLHAAIENDCEDDIGTDGEGHKVCIAGGLRRMKPDVHDIEIVAKPILKPPTPEFGKPFYSTRLARTLAGLEEQGKLRFIKGQEKLKQYAINAREFGVAQPLNEFTVEFYLVTPPAEFGVDLLIRTGPGSEDNNFSKWVVTPRAQGGALPDGYRVSGAAVWREDQLDEKRKPLKGENPLPMPTEGDFFKFLGLKYIEPHLRRANWARR
jgi:DNA polymerase/3'-5' exonuclease PolX